MKATRQEAILRLVSERAIQTQDELIALLRERDYHVTQATVSRDIRQPKLTKVPTGPGTSRYTVPTGMNGHASPKISATFMAAITKTDYVGNTVVISTYPGMAQPVGSCIDAIGHRDVLGCVAGDDTVIVVIRDAQKADEMCDKIRQMLNTL